MKKRLILTCDKDSVNKTENANKYASALELFHFKVTYDTINKVPRPVIELDLFSDFLELNDIIHGMGYQYVIIPCNYDYMINIMDKKEDE